MSFKAQYIDNGGTTAGYDPVLVVPASAVEGDRMTVIVQTSHGTNTGAPTPPATETWTLEASASMPIVDASTSDSTVWVYGKDVSADDEANAGTKTYTWTFGASEEQCGVLILTDPAEFGEFAKTENGGTAGTTAISPSVTTTVADEFVIFGALKDGGNTFSAVPTGDATVINQAIGGTGGAGSGIGAIREEFASTGPTGTKTFTLASEGRSSYTFSLRPLDLEGITTVDTAYGVDSGELDFDDTDVDVNGANFVAPQTTGTVYLSDAATLAGSANEVDISSAVNTWADDLINLDFSQLSAGEMTSLHTLGPGTRYIIVLTSTPDEYASSAITLHRPKAFGLSLSIEFAQNAVTTPQLTPPLDKTTGDFGDGRMIESANPGTTTDPGLDEYTEDEMCFEALPNSVEDETYQFRVLIGGVVADTITVTPELTISSVSVPNITDAGDELFETTETNIVITGTNFGATETGSAKVELVNNAVYASGTKVTQSVDTWANTSIQFDLVIGSLTEIDLWLYVTDSVGTVSVGYPVQVYRTPTITNIEDEIFTVGENSIVLDGTYLQDPQGSGKLEISDNAVYATGTKVLQTINTWVDDEINFDLELGAIATETMWMWVTNDLGRRSLGTAVTITGLPISDGLWKTSSIQGNVTATGFDTTVFLIRDE